MRKLLIGAMTVGGSLGALAQEVAPSATTTPEAIAGYFTPWVENVATAMLTLLAAGAVIVGVMFAWRALKRVFNGSK
ncbi:MAG: hypothetical protein II823_05915 [Kiritimatiellae bacterium]|nr:hypothetical protein [Kiritimatiellia bacterium]